MFNKLFVPGLVVICITFCTISKSYAKTYYLPGSGARQTYPNSTAQSINQQNLYNKYKLYYEQYKGMNGMLENSNNNYYQRSQYNRAYIPKVPNGR